MKYLPPITAGILIALGGGVLVAHASVPAYVPLVTLPGVTEKGVEVNIASYLSGMIKFIIALGGALSIFMAIVGGTQYVAASINPSAKSDAKERVVNSLIGLALVLSSYLLLNSINPRLVQFSFLLPPIGGPAPEATNVSVVSPTNVAKVDALNLNPNQVAYSAALALLQAYPTLNFTSGLRTLPDQARAMSQNVARNRQWIAQTYAPSAGRDVLQAWVDTNPTVTNPVDIAAGLLQTMNTNPGMTKSISKHLTGDAFDIQIDPNINPADIRSIIVSHGGTFLDTEGGLPIWHAQF